MAHTPRPVDQGISAGQVFLGKYRVEEILGQGGMGVVARCTHLALNEQVAVKMLRRDVLRDRDAVERFMREAQAAVKLRSEYVARVSDVGTFEDGVPYMVMEFLDGHDLGQHLEEQGCIPVQWATELMLQAAEALAEAHSIGIVHRDVKPTNLFVTWRPDGTSLIKVLDFGISKAPMGTDMQLTQTQSLLGTPAYMSPEQMRSARLVDARSDIWSLGTVMYELLEGRRPFEADSFSEMCVKVAVDAPAPMVNTPPALQHVVLKCLAKSPELRYSSMAEVGRDLIPFARDQHQAMMLVERMQRMLGRRSAVDWDLVSQTGVSRASSPRPARDVKSAPVRVPDWHGTSDPAGMQFPNTPASGVVQPFPYREPSAPVGAATEVRPNHAPRKSTWFWIAAVALGVGLGVAIAVALSAGDPASSPAVAAPDDRAGSATGSAGDQPLDPAAGSAIDPAAGDPTAADKAAADQLAADQLAADKLAADKAAADKAAADKLAADKLAADKATAKHATDRPSGKRPPKGSTKPSNLKPEVKPEVKQDPKPSDPFASPRPEKRGGN